MQVIAGQNFIGRDPQISGQEFQDCNFAAPLPNTVLHLTNCKLVRCNLLNRIIDPSNTIEDCLVAGSSEANLEDALVVARTRRIAQMDERTEELLAQGFTWNGNTFAMTVQAQADWEGLILLLPSLVYPVRGPVKTIDRRSIEFDNQGELLECWGTGVQRKLYIEDTSIITDAIYAAQTIAEIETVPDARE